MQPGAEGTQNGYDCRRNRIESAKERRSREPDSLEDDAIRSPIMSKGNKVRKKEVKKPKQDKKVVKK
jgi:hypothetical protein